MRLVENLSMLKNEHDVTTSCHPFIDGWFLTSLKYGFVMDVSSIKKLMFRAKDSHKGQHGSVLVVGGSEDYVGTLALVGVAALRAGCDIVTVAAPEKVAWAVNCLSADLITKKLPGKFLGAGSLARIAPILDKFDVVAVGNGIGLREETKQFCRKLMNSARAKLKVVDADAIKLLSLKEINNAIITPHAVELRMLLENSGLGRINKIKNTNKKLKALRRCVGSNVLLVKGPTDYIISNKKIIKVSGGNPGMAKAGMGDVLAGLCAGFLAQTHDLFKSAEAASTVNKWAGDVLLRKKKGYCFIASDLVKELTCLNYRQFRDIMHGIQDVLAGKIREI